MPLTAGSSRIGRPLMLVLSRELEQAIRIGPDFHQAMNKPSRLRKLVTALILSASGRSGMEPAGHRRLKKIRRGASVR